MFSKQRLGLLTEFVVATQLAQGTIFQFAFEHFRRRKQRVSGVSLCHFMTYSPNIKWGIIDYYGKKKLSFDFVRSSYQSLLVSPEYTKRRWRPGETFTADLWVVNDTHQAYCDLCLSWKILGANGDVFAEGAKQVAVSPDSAHAFHAVAWLVPDIEPAHFSVNLSLESSDGTTVSSNNHILFIGDQAEAKKQFLELHQQSFKQREKYGKSYFPGLWEIV